MRLDFGSVSPCRRRPATLPAKIGDSTLLGNVSSPLRSLRIYDDCHLEETLAVSCVRTF